MNPTECSENSGLCFRLWRNAINQDVLAEVAGPVGGEDLKPDLARSRRKLGLPLEETRFAGIIQAELIRSLITIHPLSPYLKLIRVPETSGSDGAPSEHPDLRLH